MAVPAPLLVLLVPNGFLGAAWLIGGKAADADEAAAFFAAPGAGEPKLNPPPPPGAGAGEGAAALDVPPPPKEKGLAGFFFWSLPPEPEPKLRPSRLNDMAAACF